MNKQGYTFASATSTTAKALLLGAALSATGGAYAAGDKGDVTLAYVEWSSEVASTNVVKAVLEEQGYNVELKSLSAAAMWQAVAFGDADGMVAAWLPTTHEDYMKKVSAKIEDLGVNLDGTKLGLVVPTYSKLNSIEDLKTQGDDIDDRIIGIEPGAGLTRLTEKVVEDYGLEDIDLRTGSGATMTAALNNAIKGKRDIVVTGWTPHWMFARWDLKYLDDPKNVYGGAEQIHTIARLGLKEDMPEVYSILDNFHWTPEQMGQVMLKNQEKDADPYENAKAWVDSHPDIVKGWLPATAQ
ncbi:MULTISPECIES: glycine betaine ABC transporter substrate-binding protein [Cobetia]|uniref:Glycine betaine ABC transporter substrate-binding protein n=1 Tax=Cobetia crustatorum TaxID=553385 RepID=A0A558HKS4_9GAMM|nr:MULTISPECIES: glycine betaine ABC transporter substrate-binding protein [Cobetia]TVU69733.1 glycine betaine ABC transporter substrate-binding protein [Cobetia crustatorum]